MADILTDPRFVRFAEKALVKGLGGLAEKLENGPGFVAEGQDMSAFFYRGSEAFLSTPAENARWRLGYAIVDLTPADYRTHDYYLGGYLTAENGFNPPRPLAIDLYYNETNTKTINGQTLEKLGRLNIVYWVMSNAAGNKVNVTLSKFDGSDRWYVTSGVTSAGLFYDQRAGLTAEAREKLYN